ncbi:hypothetical protein ABI59_07300 [Acidobacteria bacterium Mor1]|nr:hypothetical protein ABI59_07300 [Acidobacteria bacterium Mor1]
MLDAVRELLSGSYGVDGELKRLPGENENYSVTAGEGGRYVLKLADAGLRSDELELEHQAVEHAQAATLGVALPRIRPTKRGSIEARSAGAGGLRGRLLEFVSGSAWCDRETPPGTETLRALGSLLARLDLALARVSHPAAIRTHRWDLTAARQHRPKIGLVEDPARRRLLEQAFHLYGACALPRLGNLPWSLIHGDANDENILLDGDRISGLLDFGDCLHNPTVCEVAIALAYVMLEREDPVEAGAAMVGGYHSVRPLSADELAVLYPLICGRLGTTVTVAAERRQIDPDHPNWFVSEGPAWRLLEKLGADDPAEIGSALAAETGIDPFADRGAPLMNLREARRRHIGPALSLSYREPLKIVRGAGAYLYDQRGRPYLDLVNNVCHVGHCHPRVVEAGQRQMAQLNTNTRYVYDGLTAYAERLSGKLPAGLDVCFFVNSGSEANELALRLAWTATGRKDLLVVDGAYHGHTSTLIDISPYKFMGKGGRGRPEPWVHVVPVADGYRGVHKGMSSETGRAYADDLGRVIGDMSTPPAAFISESLLGCGGQVIPPAGYFQRAYEHVRAAGGICIADEVQVGFGRVGSRFWAFELQDVVPDIVVMGKPIGNGHPMSAVVTTREIADAFANGMEFFATFGGNPVSCAIGMAVLDVVDEEGLQQHALEVGSRFKRGLELIKEKHALIGDVRGEGLFLGIELVRDRKTLEPADTEAAELIERMKRRGVLLSVDGPLHNVLKIKPPMVLSADDVDMVLRTLSDELTVL